MKRMSIRWQLTIWYGSAVAIILIAFCVTLYFFTRHQLLNRTDASLREELREIALEAEIAKTESDFLTSAAARFFQHDIYDFAVLDGSGRTVFASQGLLNISLTAVQTHHVSSTVQCLSTDITDRGTFRIASVSRSTAFGHVSVLAVTSLQPLTNEMQSLQFVVLTLLPIGFILALAGGWLLASRALAPVRKIADLANAITINSLNQRVEIQNTHDEIGQLAATLNSLIERLEKAVLEIKRFTADASHELRTPLAALRIEAELALQTVRTPAQYQQALTVVVEEATRLGRLADQLLHLSRHDAGIVDSSVESVELNAVLHDVIEQFSPLASQRSVTLNAGEFQTACVRGDDLQLRQIFVNIVENALKYTCSGGTVQIRCRTRGQLAVCEIEDNGIGISDEHLPYLFDRFYRIDTSRQIANGGTGLGLAIARAAVIAHGGTIDIRSVVDSGTTVTVSLPCELQADLGIVDSTKSDRYSIAANNRQTPSVLQMASGRTR
ncbi:MAG: ATP-binding protein [Planctomycetota bacterium]|nr:ATP-binding protein [Planctomycetota bacterium]